MVMMIMLVKMTMMMVMIVGMCLQKYDVDVISQEISLPILFYQEKLANLRLFALKPTFQLFGAVTFFCRLSGSENAS